MLRIKTKVLLGDWYALLSYGLLPMTIDRYR